VATIAIVTSAPPLTEGGHLVIARALERALIDAGHRAGIVTTASNRFGRQASAYLANWLTDVGMTGSGERIDQVISLRFPSYAVRHPRHVCWLNHTMREYYDLWPSFSEALSWRGRTKETVRRSLIHAADRYLLRQGVSKLFAQSGTIRDRLKRWNGIDAEVLYPPAPARAYRCDEYGDFVLFASRLAPLKRAELLLRALAEPAARDVRCVIAGEGEERGRLEALAETLGLAGRASFVGHVTEDALVDLLARCRAVVFPPFGEDFGFVTVEAFAASKPVITCHDSGGPAELVDDGVTGVVTAPEPAALAAGMARLVADQNLAVTLGRQARLRGEAITWRQVAERLVIV